jgi:NADH dehydrogenase [ubiquinone] 1 alpha subcomplex assembly factor 5
MLQNFIFDRRLLLQKRFRSASILYKSDFLIKRSFDDLVDRTKDLDRKFLKILDLDNRINYDLKRNFSPQSHIIKGYINVNEIITDEFGAALDGNQFDLIISVLNLHSINDLPGCFIQLKNLLQSNGVLMASMFGEMNLFQLRDVLMHTEVEFHGGASPRFMPSIGLKQLGALLQRAGFIMPVLDVDRVEVDYSHPLKLLEDLRSMGETNIMIDRNKNYLGKNFWLSFPENYRKLYSSGKSVVATYEILNLTALK